MSSDLQGQTLTGQKLVKADDGITYWCLVPTQLQEALTQAFKLRPKPLLIVREALPKELQSIARLVSR